MLLIGIDPGVHTGFASWDTDKKEFTVLKTLTFWKTIKAFEAIDLETPKELIHVYIEDPGGNKPTFGRSRMSKAILDRKSQNVGSNKAEARLLIEYLKMNGYNYTAVVPTASKLKAEGFEKMTKITTRTSQHVRDAAFMVYGRNN